MSRFAEMLLQDHLTRAASTNGEAIALVMDEERLTYGEVEDLSGRLAAMLVERGCRPGDRVGLLIPKRPSAIVAMHAVLKAGCAYVPLDTESPAPRLAHVLGAAEPSLILSVPDQTNLIAELSAVADLPPVGLVEPGTDRSDSVDIAFAEEGWRQLEPIGTVRGLAPEAPAHILFTSGSTGVPKGVVITHRNVTAFIEWAIAELEPKSTDRISGHPPLHFDLSTFDIYGTFAAGAELHLIPPPLNLNPRGTAALIRDSELTQWFSVPSALSFMTKFDVVKQGDFPSLERLLWCGEVLPTPILRHWMERLPHVRFMNLYGPTETTIASSFYNLPGIPADEAEPVPIGVACDGEELLVLDESLEQVTRGETGDLYIAGAGLSPGYWRDQEKTASAFFPDPRNPGDSRIYRTGDLARIDDGGLFHFLGRADSQIKSRGYRIELGEIEAALGAVPEVTECAVIGAEIGGFEGTTICAAYVSERQPPYEPSELRKSLLEILPAYMIPTRWLSSAELPKNQNGKIDRPALRREFETM